MLVEAGHVFSLVFTGRAVRQRADAHRSALEDQRSDCANGGCCGAGTAVMASASCVVWLVKGKLFVFRAQPVAAHIPARAKSRRNFT